MTMQAIARACTDCGREIISRRPRCGRCEYERQKPNARAYYRKNRERLRAQSRAWARANPERRRAAQRRWLIENRAHHNAKTLAWQRAHPERTQEIARGVRERRKARLAAQAQENKSCPS